MVVSTVVLMPMLLQHIVGRITDVKVSMVMLMSVLLPPATGRITVVMASMVMLMPAFCGTSLDGSPK